MEKEMCKVKFTEIDDGIKIEAKGEGIKGCLEACQRGNFNCCSFSQG